MPTTDNKNGRQQSDYVWDVIDSVAVSIFMIPTTLIYVPYCYGMNGIY